MKRFFIACMTIFTALSFTPEEREKIIFEIKSDSEKKKDSHDERGRLDDNDINLISKVLENSYFGERFSNFKGILGVGNEGVVLNVDFQLLVDYPQTIPVALKIDYTKFEHTKEKKIKNYFNLMVNPDDQTLNQHKHDHELFDLSKHYQKLLHKDLLVKNDVPYVNMIYEAATIHLDITYDAQGHDQDYQNNTSEDDSQVKVKNVDDHGVLFVGVTVTQLGFSDLFSYFLQKPESAEILNSNSENVARIIVQICYAFWKINEQGFTLTNFQSKNLLVTKYINGFSPLIIDLENLLNLKELKKEAAAFNKKMLDESNPNYLKNLKYIEDNFYLTKNLEDTKNFKQITPDSPDIFTPFWQERVSGSNPWSIVDFKYNIGTKQMVALIGAFFKFVNENKLIDETHENITKLKSMIEIFEKMIDKKQWFTSFEVLEQLNQASGLQLNLTDLHPENLDLENYFEEIRIKNKSQVPKKNIEKDIINNERLILV